MTKVLTLDELKSRLKTDTQIIFTHGAYDLFHIGHLHQLKESKNFGGKLVVGIDSDESVKAYKRDPIFSQEYRVHTISRLEFVDYVIPLRKITRLEDLDYYYIKLYLQIKPSVVTFGKFFPYKSEVGEKCKLMGIKDREVTHKYSDVHTSGYIEDIVSQYITDDMAQYEEKTSDSEKEETNNA